MADHAEVLRGPEGTCCHRVGVLRDVTDRKRMEEAAAKKESRQHGLLGSHRLGLRLALAAVAGAFRGGHRGTWCAVASGLLVAAGIALFVHLSSDPPEAPRPMGIADVAAPVEVEQAAMATAEEIHQLLHVLKEELAVVKAHAAELTQQLIHLKSHAQRGQPMGAEAGAAAPTPQETSLLFGSGSSRGSAPASTEGSATPHTPEPSPAESGPSVSPQHPAPDPPHSR